MDDDRFKNIATDPRFRPLPSRFRKVKIDDRFKGMFTEKKFKVKCSVDERGRPVKLSSNKHLKKFYDLSSEEEESDDEEEEGGDVSETSDKEDITETRNTEETSTTEVASKTNKERKRKKKRAEDKLQQASDDEEVDEDVGMVQKKKEINPMEDYARGVVMMSSSSEDEDDESIIPYDQEAHDDHYWGEHDEDAESTEEITNRLAIQNMDWDRIKAYDLFMLLDSFKPSSGTVHSVKIYPSEFGKEKMKEDELTGPKELRNSKLDDAGEGEGKIKHLSEKDQKKAMQENLRQYQLNRLKYFYAVAVFDSADTANYIYTNCDSKEYLASCTQLDLRFVPEGMEFDEKEVKDSANHVPDNYEPKFFINPALGQSLVRCTWDENGPDRYSILNKKYKTDELEQLDIDNYLASESDEDVGGEKSSKKAPQVEETRVLADDCSDDEEGEESIEKYRALLLGGADKSNKEEDEESDGAVDLEITWETGLKDATEDLVKKKEKLKKGKTGSMSVFEKEREKKREKAKLLKKEKQLKEKEDKEKTVSERPKKKKKNREVSPQQEISVEETMQAFSDDEIPEGMDLADLMGSDGDSSSPATNKKDKKKKKHGGKTKVLIDNDNTNEDGDGDALDLMLMNDPDESRSKKHFNIKEIAEYDNMTKSKKKRKIKKNQLKQIEDDFEIDVDDDRFSAMYSSHMYNIDPSSQDYRKTKAMDKLINEKQRRIRDSERTIDRPKKRKLDNESQLDSDLRTQSKLNSSNISSLVKSVKAKTKLHSSKYSKEKKGLA